MIVSPGTRLGPYEIVSRIGAGGMGEVFRARDTRLDRSVAIKILPAEFAASAHLRARFEREARVISQFNHPNICTLFDVGENYLVMELLEGESLAERLGRGALPIREALRVGIQIADALDRAHRSGIVHRDLKPGNVMLTKGGAKLLDFGLAKTGAEPVSLDGATEQRPLTQEGMILGTFQYMSPEQLEGADVDARSDIFAFGAMLYEMVTGHHAFEGKTKTSLIAAIVSADPKPMAEAQPLTPRALEKLVRACIAREPDERIQTAHDVALQLGWISETLSSASGAQAIALPRRRLWVGAGITGALLATAIATWVVATRWQRAQTPRRIYRSTVESAEGAPLSFLSGCMAVSPDGSMLTYAGISKTGEPILFLRKLNENSWRTVEGTGGAHAPFWSPDGSRIAFFSHGLLKSVPANAVAATETVASVGGGAMTGTWSGNTILYASYLRGIYRVPSNGGEPVNILPVRKPYLFVGPPTFLPDGNHFAYFAETPGADEGVNLIATLDGSAKPRPLLKGDPGIQVVGDMILFSRRGMLYAQRFNSRSLTIEGEPHAIENVQTYSAGRPAMYSASENALVFLPPGSDVHTQIQRVDHTGKLLATIASAGFYFSPRLSPDGKRVAADVSDTNGNGDIWIWDVDHPNGTRFTFDPVNETMPVWSPDAKRLAFIHGAAISTVVDKPLQGGELRQLVEHFTWQFLSDWSPDGRTLLIQAPEHAGSDSDLFTYSFADQKLRKIVATPGFDGAGRFAPDGRWFAYVSSNQSGHYDVFVEPFPQNGSKWQISTAGGIAPVWARDGKALYFIGTDGKLMETAVTTQNGFMTQPPHPLFGVRLRESNAATVQYDVAPDGSFILDAIPDNASSPMTLVVNWREGLAH